MSSRSIRWNDKELQHNLEGLSPKIKAAMVASANVIAPRGESWMKQHAPWTDRTANARNGLFAKPEARDDQVRIVFSHTVPYGVWLEIRWEGRYAIIMPAVKEFALQWVALLNRMASR